MGVDYYNVLRVERTASEEELRKSFKRLAMKWHPDKNAVNTEVAEAKFKQINEAYDVLSDPAKRQIYDLFGEEGLKSGMCPPQRDMDSGYGGRGKEYKDRARDAEETFEEFFGDGGGAAGGGFRKAAVMESKLACSLEELYKGSRRKLKTRRIVLDFTGKPVTVEEVLSIHIKPGWKKGTKITFPNKGNYEPGLAPGDLIFVVDEMTHPTFKRDRNDLIINQKISLLDALTGKKLHINTLDGRLLAITLSEIVKPGHEMVIVNEGMPITKEPGKRGNLKIRFDVKFPSRLSSDQKSDLRRVLSRA